MGRLKWNQAYPYVAAQGCHIIEQRKALPGQDCLKRILLIIRYQVDSLRQAKIRFPIQCCGGFNARS